VKQNAAVRKASIKHAIILIHQIPCCSLKTILNGVKNFGIKNQFISDTTNPRFVLKQSGHLNNCPKLSLRYSVNARHFSIILNGPVPCVITCVAP
jgi:hypothetical protein